MPTKKLIGIMDKLEFYFKQFHGDTINTKKCAVDDFVSMVARRESSIPKKLLLKFARSRLFIRIKCLNEKLQVDKKSLKRKYAMHVNKM